jgi:2-oxoglutarate ferredoxin oxidoreductase subunit delta
MKTSPKKKTTEEIIIDDRYCKGCFLCIAVCPKKVMGRGEKRSRAGYSMPRVENLEACISCALCEMTCPDLALTVVQEKT